MAAYQNTPNYCPQCGFNLMLHFHQLKVVAVEKKWQDVKFIIIFYFLIFVTLASLRIYPPLKNSFLGEQITEWMGLFITILFLFLSRVDKKNIISKFNIFKSTAIVILFLILTLLVNTYYTKFLKLIFGINNEENDLADKAIIFSIFFLVFYDCVMPAITEEIAFRLIIFEKFKNVVSLKEAVLLSSILFAILHVKFYITPYYIFAGAILCWIRLYSKSLIPCIILHFLHNLYITLIESQYFK